MESRSADILAGIEGGGVLGAYSGAIRGFVALLYLALPRPRLQGKGVARLRKSLAIVGGFVALGTPILCVGFSVVALGVMPLLGRTSQFDNLNDVFGLILYAHFLFVAFSALVGSIAAARSLGRFETETPRVSLPLTL